VWITLSTGIFIIAFSLLGAQIFQRDIENYLPYFAAGHIYFSFLSTLTSESCSVYVKAEAYLKQSAVPKMLFILSTIVRNLIFLAHNIVIILAVVLWMGKFSQIRWFDLLAGLVLALGAAYFGVAILAAIATRFRDVRMMVSSTMQVMFFLTPVMWRPDQLTESAQWLVILNPYAVFLELVRSPILGMPVTWQTYLSSYFIIILLVVVYILLYLKVRRKIVYWL
jgi:lipopolysaccharide transport system permease protein